MSATLMAFASLRRFPPSASRYPLGVVTWASDQSRIGRGLGVLAVIAVLGL